MPKELTIQPSPIDGLGVFATEDIPMGTFFGDHPTHLLGESECLRLNFGGYINHSETNNCLLIDSKVDKKAYLVTTQDIKQGDEITVDYKETTCGKDYVHLLDN